jgi:TetR/AcrR family transcriptional regulator, cholesterol catabolism regulator
VINARSDVRAVAVALFAEGGYRATGVRDIADALGIGATSIYSHIKSKAELLHEIVIDFLDALLAVQHDAIASTPNVVEQLPRAAESQMRFLVEHPQEALIAIRDFRWAEGDALVAIQERRRRYRTAFEDLLAEGERQGLMSVSSAKIGAFAIIEMAEGVPRWFSSRARGVDKSAGVPVRRVRTAHRGRLQRGSATVSDRRPDGGYCEWTVTTPYSPNRSCAARSRTGRSIDPSSTAAIAWAWWLP